MYEGYEQTTVASMSNGEVAAEVNHLIKRMIENIKDPNTDPAAKRSITLKIDFVSAPDRSGAAISAQCTAKLAPDVAVVDQVSFGQDGNGYRPTMQQMEFDPVTGEVPRIGEDTK